MDNATGTGESYKAELHEGDNKATCVSDDLEVLMNFYSTTSTCSPIELQPSDIFCQEVISTTDALSNPAVQTIAVAQTESTCSIMKDSTPASKGKSRKGNRGNKPEGKNWRPCSYCQKQQKKVRVMAS
ncbi:hypothetical protein ACEPAG_4875 [Sanghuangporus baumii]